MRSLIVFSIFTFAAVVIASASPRKQRTFDYKADPEFAPVADVSLSQDATSQKLDEEAAIILEESREGPRLTERRYGETFLQYRERLERARENMQIDESRDEELRESQQEAIYEAQYALRRETFGGSHSAYGHGAGPVGNVYNPPLELGKLWDYLFAPEEELPEAEAAPEAKSDS